MIVEPIGNAKCWKSTCNNNLHFIFCYVKILILIKLSCTYKCIYMEQNNKRSSRQED